MTEPATIYVNGPLQVTRSGSKFHFAIEVGQGAKHEIYRSSRLEAALSFLLQESHVPAFHVALEELQTLGQQTNWDWEKITRETKE